MESSRTGAQKRICDTCYKEDKDREAALYAEDEDEDEGTASATAAMSKAKISSGGGGNAKAASGGGGGSSGGASAPASAGGMKLPDISKEESAAAMAEHPFEGQWKFSLAFATVDLGAARAIAASAPGVDVASYKTAAASGAMGKKGQLAKDGTVRVGSRLHVVCTLKTRSGGYFGGECSEFGQFGKVSALVLQPRSLSRSHPSALC
jgi:hypothetical protein